METAVDILAFVLQENNKYKITTKIALEKLKKFILVNLGGWNSK